jgi:hypothetical protein
MLSSQIGFHIQAPQICCSELLVSVPKRERSRPPTFTSLAWAAPGLARHQALIMLRRAEPWFFDADHPKALAPRLHLRLCLVLVGSAL